MGADDDTTCVGHVWKITTVVLAPGGAQTEYVCVRPGCQAVLLVPPGEALPGTV